MISDEGAALEKGQYLLDHHFAHSLSGSEKFEKSSSLYRLLEDDDSSALNQGDTSDCVSRTGTAPTSASLPGVFPLPFSRCAYCISTLLTVAPLISRAPYQIQSRLNYDAHNTVLVIKTPL